MPFWSLLWNAVCCVFLSLMLYIALMAVIGLLNWSLEKIRGRDPLLLDAFLERYYWAAVLVLLCFSGAVPHWIRQDSVDQSPEFVLGLQATGLACMAAVLYLFDAFFRQHQRDYHRLQPTVWLGSAMLVFHALGWASPPAAAFLVQIWDVGKKVTSIFAMFL